MCGKVDNSIVSVDMAEKKKPKKPRKKQSNSTPYTKEQVEQFIEDAMGSITQAAGNLGVPYSTFYSWMEKYGCKAYPDKIKRRVALMALDRAKFLALTPAEVLKKKGEKQSITLLQDILNKWGKYIEFEEPAKKLEVTEMHDPGEEPYEKPEDLMQQRDESLGK